MVMGADNPAMTFCGSWGREVDEYVLTLRADDDASADGAGMALSRVGELEPCATHAEGFDTSPFIMDGQEIDPASCLSADGLLNDTQNEFVGGLLWQRLTPGDIGTELNRNLHRSRIYLDLRSDALTAYPWELLCNSGWSLFVVAQMCLGRPDRSATPGPAGDPPAADFPLRVLVVVGTDPDDDTIRANEELVAIEAEAHARNTEVLMQALIRPQPEDIEDKLNKFQPHVFHFIGHGDRQAPQSDPEIYVYAAETRQNDVWQANRIRDVFRRSPPGLVVLNACLTGGAPTASTSLVRAFLDAGSTAVIAMMGEIRSDASHEFGRRFYRALFSGDEVNAALAQARGALRNTATGQGSNAHLRALRSNWPLPRLTVRGDVEQAVHMIPAGQGLRRWLKEDFVLRWDERWDIWKSMDGTYSRLALVSGRKDAGKSELLNTIAETAARHGERVIMVNFGGPTTGNSWRDVLQRIADAAADEGLPASELRRIAAEDQDAESGKVIRHFQDELAQCAGPGGLLVVLDGLSEWMDELVRDTLLPYLCGPYLENTAKPPVRMMIALGEQYGDVVWRSRPYEWKPIEVGNFRDDDWQRAMTHFSAYWTNQVAEPRRDWIRDMASQFTRSGPRDGIAFDTLRRFAERIRQG
jgi:hypothetical protein